MTDLAQRLTKAEREQRWKNQRPKDAATVIDRLASSTKRRFKRYQAETPRTKIEAVT